VYHIIRHLRLDSLDEYGHSFAQMYFLNMPHFPYHKHLFQNNAILSLHLDKNDRNMHAHMRNSNQS